MSLCTWKSSQTGGEERRVWPQFPLQHLLVEETKRLMFLGSLEITMPMRRVGDSSIYHKAHYER